MDTQIIAALITGCATVVATFIAGFFTLKKCKKHQSIRINNNSSVKIKDTLIEGDVTIDHNKDLEIHKGIINGKS